jgi:PHS family inorganic phosphate transporter-like MFS transporter
MYNFNSISMALLIMSESECTLETGCADGSQQVWVNGGTTSVIFIGAVIGQLCFGYLGDQLGRGLGMFIVLLLTTVAAILSGACPTGSPPNVYGTIILFRFLLGLGVGGINPLSATMAVEQKVTRIAPSGSQSRNGTHTDEKKYKYDTIARTDQDEDTHKREDLDVMVCCWATFWSQPGLMGPWLVGFALTYTNVSTDLRWRLVLMLGAVPSLVALMALMVLMTLSVERLWYAGKPFAASEPLSDRIAGTEEACEMTATPQASNKHTSTSTSTSSSSSSSSPVSTMAELFMSREVLWKLFGCGGSWFLFGESIREHAHSFKEKMHVEFRIYVYR